MSRGELLLRGALRDIPKSGCKGNYIRFCANLDFSMFIICKLCQFIFSHPCFFFVNLLLTLLIFFHIKLTPCSLFNCKVVLHSAVTAFDLAIAIILVDIEFFFLAEIPVFPTITARVTFRDFKSCSEIPSSMFFIPRDYKVSHAFVTRRITFDPSRPHAWKTTWQSIRQFVIFSCKGFLKFRKIFHVLSRGK